MRGLGLAMEDHFPAVGALDVGSLGLFWFGSRTTVLRMLEVLQGRELHVSGSTGRTLVAAAQSSHSSMVTVKASMPETCAGWYNAGSAPQWLCVPDTIDTKYQAHFICLSKCKNHCEQMISCWRLNRVSKIIWYFGLNEMVFRVHVQFLCDNQRWKSSMFLTWNSERKTLKSLFKPSFRVAMSTCASVLAILRTQQAFCLRG